jgi:hypothetical protein
MFKMQIMWFLQLMSIQVKVIYINIVNIVEFVTCFDNELIFLYGFGTCHFIMIDLTWLGFCHVLVAQHAILILI